MTERKIARFQPPQVTEHFRFAVMNVEDRVSEKGGTAKKEMPKKECRTLQLVLAIIARMRATKNCDHVVDVTAGGGFIEGNADGVCAERPEIVTGTLGSLD